MDEQWKNLFMMSTVDSLYKSSVCTVSYLYGNDLPFTSEKYRASEDPRKHMVAPLFVPYICAIRLLFRFPAERRRFSGNRFKCRLLVYASRYHVDIWIVTERFASCRFFPNHSDHARPVDGIRSVGMMCTQLPSRDNFINYGRHHSLL